LKAPAHPPAGASFLIKNSPVSEILAPASQPRGASATRWEGASLTAPLVAESSLPRDLAPQLRPTSRAQTSLWSCVSCVSSLVDQRVPRSSTSS
jgi:hypothetical protein